MHTSVQKKYFDLKYVLSVSAARKIIEGLVESVHPNKSVY